MPSMLVVENVCARCAREVDDVESAVWCSFREEWRCATCDPCSACGPVLDEGAPAEQVRREVEPIMPWNYKPEKFRARGHYARNPLMGIELEVGGPRDKIAEIVTGINAGTGHLYMKNDASIDGVEIVTHPMTLAWARRFQFGRLLKQLQEPCHVTNGYGLHIHISRHAFRRGGRQSAAHQMIWLLFIYRNSDKLEKLARRSSNRWARFSTPYPGELARKAQVSPTDEDRYVAVNCSNKDTFELRFFKSTLNKSEFYSALEFADASVRYTRSLTSRDVLHSNAITWPHFTSWVRQQRYPHLLEAVR